MKIGYRRVSTIEQKLDRQDLELHGCERVYEEKVSGKDRERPELEKALARLDAGDTLVVWSIDRLARNLRDLETMIIEINSKGAAVEFVTEKLLFRAHEDDPLARLQVQLMGAFAEFERKLTHKRQMEGIERAKAAGKFLGRKPTINRPVVQHLLKSGARPSDIADQLGIGVASVYRIRKETNLQDHENTGDKS